MIDEKIPEDERDRIPVLADGDHVLWVVGYRISDYYKITDETEHILEAEVKLPDGGRTAGRRRTGRHLELQRRRPWLIKFVYY